jgi:hypothetical protein
MTLVLRPLAAVGVAALALSMASCSSRTDGRTGAEATGRVTLDGRPFAAGAVVFVGPSGSTAAEIKPDGSYRADNVPLGVVRVAIVNTGPTSTPRGGYGPAPQIPTPPRYRSADTSGLKLDVSTGGNPFDVAMTSR